MRTNAINILLADDDVKNSLLLKKFLEVENYVVSYVPDGITAWEMYQKQHPDLILLDVNMPGMSGFELAQRIRETDNKVLIFFLTDRTEKADRLKGFSLKGNDYIPKPFYPEELIAKIAERFEQRKINAQCRYNIGKTLFDSNLSMVTFDGITQNLSARQTDILVLLAQNIGKLVPRNEILDNVWGDSSYANSMSLNVQITYLRHILAPDTAVKIISIKKKGYILQVMSY
ncbi:MAG: response regulator transcription factor [Phocaeicola sp.]|nr:response regulator transcription factor [Phocaeicola sp.]